MPHLWSLKKYSDHFSRCVVASLSVRTRPLPYVKQSSSLWECFACVLTAAKQDHFFPQKIIYIHIFPCNAAHSQISLNIFVHVFVQVFPPYEKKKGGGGGRGDFTQGKPGQFINSSFMVVELLQNVARMGLCCCCGIFNMHRPVSIIKDHFLFFGGGGGGGGGDRRGRDVRGWGGGGAEGRRAVVLDLMQRNKQHEATPTQKSAQKWCCNLSRLLAWKITKGIHSCKPASLNGPLWDMKNKTVRGYCLNRPESPQT